MQLVRSRELDEYFAQASDQMEITDSLIREMRQMGQPCDAYQKRYCPGSTDAGRPHEEECRTPGYTQSHDSRLPLEEADIPKESLAYLVFHGFLYL